MEIPLMTFYQEKQADLREEILEEPVEIGWMPNYNPNKPSQFRSTETFHAIQSDTATRFTFVSGGAVRGSDFFLVADKRDFPDLETGKPQSGYLMEVPVGSGKLFRVGEIQTSETDPAVELVMIAKDAISQQ
jgi:hypothetical protein